MDTAKKSLEESNFEYEFLYHEKQLSTASEGAEYFGIEAGQTAPTLIIKTDKGYFSIIFSGCRSHIDFEQIAKLLDVPRVKLANRDKIKSITGFSPGDTPMVGLTLSTIFDKKLLQYPFVYGGSGHPNRTLKISPEALVKLNNVVAYLENN